MTKPSTTSRTTRLPKLWRWTLSVACASAVACAGPARTQGLSVVAPTSLGEGDNEHAARPTAPGVAASGASSAVPPGAGGVPPSGRAAGAAPSPEEKDVGGQPDPVPLVTPHQWDLTLRYSKGKVALKDARSVELGAAIPTARHMGRFAVELWVGKELVDRVRFEFPLLGADFAPSPGTHQERGAPRFSKGADTITTVRVPASDRATSARVVNRLTGSVEPIPWPPPPAGPVGSAAPPPSAVPPP